MTATDLIRNYARFLRHAENWQTQATALRDKIAKRIEREGNFNNGSRATRYSVRETTVRRHQRRGYNAVRITA